MNNPSGKTPPPGLHPTYRALTSVTWSCQVDVFPLQAVFRIARGARTEQVVVRVVAQVTTLSGLPLVAQGEAVPYARYGESVDSVTALIEKTLPQLTMPSPSDNRALLQTLLPAGAARNALDCALWDLQAKLENTSVAQLLGLQAVSPLTTAYTLSLDTPEAMAAAAARAAHRPLLKIKLGHEGDPARLKAVRAAAAHSALIVDANEGWTPDNLAENFAACAEAGVVLIEQPLPATDDSALSSLPHPVPVCADESVHGRDTLAALKGRYEAINIKLDKTGGLTEALLLCDAAQAAGLMIMVGCMVGTSLAMAPAFYVAQNATWVDLDGPLLLAADRTPPLVYLDSLMQPPDPRLWG